MQKIINPEQGVYCLVIKGSSKTLISNKKFCGIIFPVGYYYYVGSAQKNLTKRIERHFRKVKKIHWHIDYLTTSPLFNCIEAYIFKNETKSHECKLSQDFADFFKLKEAALNFGNSDCNKCNTHLYYSTKKIPYSHFISRYQSIERFIPSSRDTF